LKKYFHSASFHNVNYSCTKDSDLPDISGQLIKPHFFLEVFWTEITEIGMAALPIVKPFNIFKNSRLGFLTSIVSFSVNQLHLYCMEEALRYSVIPAIDQTPE